MERWRVVVLEYCSRKFLIVIDFFHNSTAP
jgi:hypothetical protein